jgi:cytoskeletal protein RodZ
MKSKVQMRNVLLSVLVLAAIALLSPAVLRAQTASSTTTVSPADTTATSSGTTTTTTSSKPMPATTDTTAETSVGIGSGVTSVAGDSNGNVYASLQFSNKVVKLNGAGTEVARFAVGGNPTGLLVDNANSVLYVLNNADNTVSKLGLDGTLLATYKVGGDGPVHAALYGGTLYIACERSNTLVRMTTAGAALGSTPVGARPVWVAIGVTYSKTAMTADSTAVAPADSTATAPADTTATPTDSTAVAPTDSTASSPTRTGTTVTIYVSCNKANQVWKLSSAGALLAQYNSGRGPYGIVVNSYGDVLVACFWDGIVQRLSGADGSVLSKTAVGDGAAGLISYGNVVAVIANGANSITRLSAADGTFISSDKVDRSPLIGAATSSALWVGCTGSGTIARRAL